MKTSGASRREIAKRVYRHRARKRSDPVPPETLVIEPDRPRRTGCPAFAEHDSLCVETAYRPLRSMETRHLRPQ